MVTKIFPLTALIFKSIVQYLLKVHKFGKGSVSNCFVWAEIAFSFNLCVLFCISCKIDFQFY